MNKLFEEIEKLICTKPDSVIGIDGYCASGKTTLAMQIVSEFDVQIIHMDDFFLPFDMRTEQRLSETGGNVHYERFNAEVVSGLKSKEKFSYRAFSCKNGAYEETKSISPGKPVIIEGAYAFHPEINLDYDLKIFCEADYETRLSRILERNGPEALEVFKTKWIPLENKYFEGFNIKAKCDITVKQTEKL